MTVTMKPRVECDTCGEVREGTDGENAFDFRERLRSEGWSNFTSPGRMGGEDECKGCRLHREGGLG